MREKKNLYYFSEYKLFMIFPNYIWSPEIILHFKAASLISSAIVKFDWK